MHRKVLLILLLVTAPLAPAADRERVKEIGHKLICTCGGCQQLLTTCNHVGCPNATPMREELARMIDEGQSEQTILAAFVEKYGLSVLSAPPASGFNLSAWLMPFVALGAGAIMVVYLGRQWKGRWRPQVAAASAQEKLDVSKYQQRLDDELEKFTPED